MALMCWRSPNDEARSEQDEQTELWKRSREEPPNCEKRGHQGKKKYAIDAPHLEIENDGALAAQDGGRVGQKGIQDAKIPGMDLDAVHDGVLVDV